MNKEQIDRYTLIIVLGYLTKKHWRELLKAEDISQKDLRKMYRLAKDFYDFKGEKMEE